MAARSGVSSSVPSLPPPCPKSPPEYPDLYGKRRETAKVQMLEREIRFLEEELKSVESLQSASRYCKEVTDFVMANSDPLIPTSQKNRKSYRFWKWLCGLSCFNLSWICCCCYSWHSCHLKCPRSCKCSLCDCSSCKCYSCNCNSCLSCCTIPKWRCCSCPKSSCCRKISCSRNCCIFQFPSCTDCCCCGWKCCCPKCPKIRPCRNCTKTCCNPCCLLF
ncbi:guanine nucleotide-binding protein subunit gamma 3-like [Durio zibethinus]|uniref:Guanine nucleotide-binding protein subunit gamma 3-like n=1 Tax=Durio zibethinus TaxID=66656 RepID=A0A6P5ZC68_DURZI|nr:guanine nucleotide-binding protein subunit gamma 3-like [Durio zibethinus]